ncbi:MAG: hypothetical protein ACE5IW_14055, partial [bacterium]
IHTAPASSAYHVKRGVSQKLRFTDLSDVKINGSYLIGDQEWLLTFGINLPIGDERLNDSEFIVANVIAEDALDFPLSLYGAGYEANVGFFRAFNLGNSTIGVGASYFLRGDFQFLDGDSTSILKPGDEITGTIGLNWKIPNGNINMDFYFTNRMHDKLRNIKVFEPGNKIVLNFSTVLKRYPFAFQFWIINRWKFGSKLAPSLQDFDFIREDLNKNPHQIELGTTLIHEIFNMSMTILYSLDLKKFAKNDAGSEDAFVYGGGIGFRLNPIEWLNLGATFKYYDGYLTSLGENFELSGFQVSGVLRFSF